MKQLLILSLLIFFTVIGKSQGYYTYTPADFSARLQIDTSILNHLVSFDAYKKMTDFEKELVYSLNYLRKYPKVFLKEAVNPYLAVYPQLKENYGESLQRQLASAVSTPELGIDIRLVGIARLHSADLGSNDMMSHRSSNGLSTQERFEKAGLSCGSECINMSNSTSSALEVLLSLLIDFNVPDLGHRKSLVNPKMTSVGIGVSKGTNGQIQYTVIDLGCM